MAFSTPVLPTPANADYVACWNETLAPKWMRFRHLLSGNGQVHSDIAYPQLSIRRGHRGLDFACGFGETTLELADRVGPLGSMLGIDCTREFVEVARQEQHVSGTSNVEYRVADIDATPLSARCFDFAVSRFGLMYCASPVRALRAIARALVPCGEVGLITWRRCSENPCWSLAEQVALRHLPAPGEQAQTCGPGPFSMSDRDTNERILAAAGFEGISVTPIEAPLCIGRTLEEAVDYQTLIGPAGFVIREAGAPGQRALPVIAREIAAALRPHVRADGSVWLGSSTWFLRGRTARA